MWHEQEAIRRLVLESFREVDADIFLFGSRASGKAREHSDYDVGFVAAEPVSGRLLSALRDRLEDLPIPNHVELVDFCRVPERFSGMVLRQKEDLKVWKTRRENSLFI
ncbi:MAG: nucleotidyltransferase domain-containing protein [Proteobacteria bacterium]|nr:nucleotidyltransferase domain-containing protein [Pseudomonadota bacterium]